MKSVFRYIAITILAGFTLFTGACKKEELLTSGDVQLRFSDDTLMYDTVFATIGSVTKNLRIYNDHDQPINISNIRLAGGNSSYFRMNVNGLPGRSFDNIELRAGDSLWIFVEVTVDPNQQLLPYIVQDSIVFETNGNQQDIDLVAWGQNAHFIVADQTLNIKDNNGKTIGQINYAVIDTIDNHTTTWDNQLPYVIYGGFAVVDSSTTLQISEGTQIHFSNNAGLWVYKGGKLLVNGSKDNPVVFQGLRREQNYQEQAGQWDRIWINDGAVNEINYAVIKNGFIGLQTETLFDPVMSNRTLNVTNTVVKNMSGLGILARNWTINATNSMIVNCGQYNAALTMGGSYDFTHCTLANFWNGGQRGTPNLYINNYAQDATSILPIDLTKADFKNSIIYGDNDNEIELDMKTGAQANYQFSNCLVKVDYNTPVTDPLHFTAIYKNTTPNFVDVYDGDYHLNPGSVCIDKGNTSFAAGIPLDLDGNQRVQGVAPDLGAYEKQ